MTSSPWFPEHSAGHALVATSVLPYTCYIGLLVHKLGSCILKSHISLTIPLIAYQMQSSQQLHAASPVWHYSFMLVLGLSGLERMCDTQLVQHRTARAMCQKNKALKTTRRYENKWHCLLAFSDMGINRSPAWLLSCESWQAFPYMNLAWPVSLSCAIYVIFCWGWEEGWGKRICSDWAFEAKIDFTFMLQTVKANLSARQHCKKSWLNGC